MGMGWSYPITTYLEQSCPMWLYQSIAVSAAAAAAMVVVTVVAGLQPNTIVGRIDKCTTEVVLPPDDVG